MMRDAGCEMTTCIAIAVVEHEGRYLIGQRPEDVPLAGMWEFPGGKIEPGETAAQAAARECLEETGLEVVVGDEYPPVVHEYDHGCLELHFFCCWPADPAPQPQPQPPYRWVERTELANYPFPPANREVLAQIGQSPRG
jgi:mutator protein MutT